MRDERGFTLVELLVGMGLMIVVLGAALTTFERFEAQSRVTTLRSEAQERTRLGITRLTRDIRNAVGSGAPVAQSVERAAGEDLVFQTVGAQPPSGANVKGVERVRYCLDVADAANGRLTRQVQTWTTATPPPVPAGTACPASGWTTTTVLADRLTNAFGGTVRPLFRYRFVPETSTALADLVAVMPTAFVDVTPGPPAPAESTLRSGVLLRNANRPPVASFTVGYQSTKVILNASASVDPEGQTLLYEWFLDGATTAAGEGVRFEYGGFAAGTHTVRLRVTDAAGAKAEQTQSVTVS